MINYLKGKVTNINKSISNRVILILEVNQIGYELQIPRSLSEQISVDSKKVIQIFTHLQIREDQPILYGFSSATERDLFRQLLGVSGIGAQIAIALIDTLGLPKLVQAIINSNIRTLAKTPGVGNKTAERIALELRTKLGEWREIAGVEIPPHPAASLPAITEEVEMTLLALGYENKEISQALDAISHDEILLKSKNPEDWIRSAIAWLSQ
ncbi:MAG TPA: Holliday junction branch migration protein RuvA [Cyanobacteria bacterium UBA11149]|nr:Holliday junction branch migration protein RuvA [Cyanobacteria bacterium UBA11367]HBE60087.1 Holliday junction branch migration protein RuvA [Cyanobacteria bacterium UBA11366]HBK64727.1 Holliday junction branch migration protein RuvA [Cyanobacteria bacterium UBA11166]HBR73228.1 Holliday junction branch migration protein RuvA [Cyanobacteria bacterium UBA11159]HBS71616.1 Holliday junction branch migration protein RuvA [Cyanobacteria bacterium UBA11153]HBW90792.1 Holliday junction branch migra